MKKQLLLLVAMLLPMVAMADESGKCGDNLTWTYNETTQTLTIEGSGPMYTYTNTFASDSPWSFKIIQKVIIEEGVTTIGAWAFHGVGISSISIPSTVTLIDYSAFRSTRLSSFIIPNSVTSIGNNAFYGCSDLTTIVSEIEKPFEIGSIVSNTAVTLVVPKGTKAAYQSTAGWSSFTNIFEADEGGVVGCSFWVDDNKYLIDEGNTASLTTGNKNLSGDYEIPTQVIFNGTTYTVTSIGNSAFSNCSGLTSMVIPNIVTSIGESAFNGCSSLTSVTIGNSVTSIGESAFANCSKLTSAIIGSGVTSIGSDAFKSTNLKKVIWLTNTPPSGYNNVSGTVNYVSNNNYASLSNRIVYPFLSSYFDVDGIRYVPVSPSERTCDAIDCVYDSTANNTVIASTVSYKGILMSVKNIQPYLAYNNIYIKSLNADIDGKVSEYAFTRCSNMSTAKLNATEIGDYAFSGCSNMSSTTLNVTVIGKYAFQNCSKMSTAKLGEKVTAIGNNAFSACSSLESIDIPDAVKTLDSYAFSGCSSLKFAKMGSGIETINEYTFSQCKSLLDVKIGNNVKKINQYAFTGCSELSSIIIPQSVTAIGNYVFSGCTQLNKVIMENSESELKLGSNGKSPLFADCKLDSVYIGRNISYNTSSSYGYSPFYRNTSLRAVKITDKEEEISQNEFYGCTNLQRVMIGDGVTTISDYAFSGCQSLKYFTFGTQVKTIGKEAFSDCTSVVEIASKAQMPPTCGTQALDDINKWNCKLFVPKGCIASYQAADQWKDFFFTEEGEGTGIEGSGETETKKCEKPTISYTNGKLTYYCETEGAMCQSNITDADIKSYSGNEVQLTATYNISVYATKAGYDNSDVATATLCWIDVEPKTEGITNGIAQVPAKAVLIQAVGGTINVQGCDDGERIGVYSINGSQVGTAISQDGAATVNTTLQPGSVAIIKVGQKSIKVVIH